MTSKNFEEEYRHWLADLKTRIKNSKLKAGLKLNTEMLSLYWELGKSISEKQKEAQWGDKIIQKLSKDLTTEFSDLQGFSRSNLFNIRKFYQFYSPKTELVQQRVGQLSLEDSDKLIQQDVGQFPLILGIIPWGHHI